jgi:hypothetical protein
MAIHLLRDLENLKKELLTVGSLVEEATNKAILALVDRRPDLADDVCRGDLIVEEQELRVEDECLKILALHQPVAADLRYVVAMLKVNNDLERVGDLAGNIAARAKDLAAADPVPVPSEITTMSDHAQRMLRDCLTMRWSSPTASWRAGCIRKMSWWTRSTNRPSTCSKPACANSRRAFLRRSSCFRYPDTSSASPTLPPTLPRT